MAVEYVHDLHAIIPAGGTGKRLWPLARVSSPKFLQDMTGSGHSLLQDTVLRLEQVCEPGNISVVTERSLAQQVKDQLPSIPEDRIIEEPIQRHSMAAVALVAALIARSDPRTIVGMFPADHAIKDTEAFADTVRKAAAIARDGLVVSVGLDPVAPATSFGYIWTGEPVDNAEGVPAFTVTGFTEKPEPEQAQTFVLTGGYLWNTGIVLAPVGVLMNHLKRLQPDLATAVTTIAEAWDTDRRDTVINEIWPTIKPISVDRALAIPLAEEGIGIVVRGEFRWDDVRDLRSLGDSLDRRLDGLRVLGADSAVAVDARGGMVISTTDRQIVILGLDDAVVVDTPDALLITTGSRCKEVPTAVKKLGTLGREELL